MIRIVKISGGDGFSFEEAIKTYTRCHIGFTSIHPFFDGNGRVSRLLSNIYMLKNGFLPLIIDIYFGFLAVPLTNIPS